MSIHYVAVVFVVAALFYLYDLYEVKKRGYSKSRSFIYSYILVLVASLAFVSLFLLNDFSLYEVYNYSSSTLPLTLKIAASWSGGGGSIVWWLLFFSTAVFLHRLWVFFRDRYEREEYSRLFTFYNLIGLALVIALFASGGFDKTVIPTVNGLGLNPLLRSFWVYFHPPTALLSYGLGLVIGASAILKVKDRFLDLTVNTAWISVTIANILGGVWAYFTLGWGGYWAWDPVETGLLLPWLSLTAYFHAKPLNVNLSRAALTLTGFSVAYAAYITRGGAYSPLHGFGGISPAGLVILLLSLPFIVYTVKFFKEFTFEEFRKYSKRVYSFSMAIAYFSILAIYLISFLGVFTQSLYTAVLGEQLQVNVNYYNYLSSPFVLAFLLVIPGCTLPELFKNLREYLEYVVGPVLVASIIGSILTITGFVTWSTHSPLTTNAIISLLIPSTLLGVATVLVGVVREVKFKNVLNLSLRVLHFSIPLMVLGVLISGPYAYNTMIFKSYKLNLGEKVEFGSLSLEYLGVEFEGLKGKIGVLRAVDLPLPSEAPDEAVMVLKFKVYRGDGSYYLATLPLRFNFGAYLRGIGGIVSEPMVLGEGLDEHYYVVASTSSIEAIFYYGKQVLELAVKSGDQMVRHRYYGLLYLLSRSVGLSFQEFVDKLSKWDLSNSQISSSVVLSYKRVPAISLVWLSSIIMVLGSLLAVITRNILIYKGKMESVER